MAFVHHTMLTAENLRGLPSKQLHTNVEPHYSPRSRAAPLQHPKSRTRFLPDCFFLLTMKPDYIACWKKPGKRALFSPN